MKWIIRSVAFLLLIALSAGLWVIFVKKDEPNPPNPQQPAPTSSVSTSPPFMGMKVSSIGGSDLAPDGTTRIRFTPDCEGAVQAAASYAKIADGPNDPKLLDKRKQTLNYVVMGNTEMLNNLRSSVIDPVIPATATYPNYGGFKINSCTPADQASISIFWAQHIDSENPKGKAIGWGCGVETQKLVWLGEDWRMTEWELMEGNRTPQCGSYAQPRALSPEQRKSALASSESGWQEFTDAPQ